MANKANIITWIDALQSRRFKQGEGALCKGGKYCCLGVACEIAQEHGVEMEVRAYPDADNSNVMVTYWDLNGWVLPEKVQAWLGIGDSNPVLAGKDAAWWNDCMKLPFTGIAQLLANEYGITHTDFYNARHPVVPFVLFAGPPAGGGDQRVSAAGGTLVGVPAVCGDRPPLRGSPPTQGGESLT